MNYAANFRTFIASDQPWVADGGLETDLIFSYGLDLPHFASFHVFDTTEGRATLARYYDRYIDIARRAGTGFVLDTATWRSGAYWPDIVGRSLADIEAATREAVRFAHATRARHSGVPMVINGAVGPAGDGYAPDRLYTPDDAEAVHAHQIGWMADEGIEMVSAVTMTHPGELNEAEELDAGNPEEFGHLYGALFRKLPQLRVMGGCCGTDHRHIEQVCLACKVAA